MSLQRRIDWSAALRTMRNDRTAAADRRAHVAAVAARNLAARTAAIVANDAVRAADAAPLVVDGAFDKSAIMRRAHARARRARANGDTRSWRDLMGLELRHAWQAARASRRAAAH